MKNKRTERIEQEIVNEILVSLSQDQIPWHKPWKDTGLAMNAVSGNVYKNSNQFLLQMKMAMLGYKDPRWATFKQANDAGWRIKAGAVGTWIYKVRLYDPIEKCDITAEYLAEKTKEEAEEVKRRARVIRKFHKVFNAEQIDGIPKLAEEDRKTIHFTNELAARFVDNALREMEVELKHGGNRAFYSPVEDYIQMPEKEQFEDETGYISTLLHEAGHATGIKKRLGRLQNSIQDSDEYAKEELIAELTSAFLSVDLGLKMEQKHIEQHKAYCQSWYKEIKADYEAFFDSWRKAQEARMYLHEKGNYLDLYKENQLSEEHGKFAMLEKEEKLEKEKSHSVSLEELKSMSIKEYAENIGYHVLPVSGALCQLEEHDSCMIYPNNTFYRFSTRKGGSLIDFIMEFEEVDLKGAVKKATEYYNQNNPELIETQLSRMNQQPIRITNIEMPKKSEDIKKVKEYLSKERCIDDKVIERYIKEGMLYQDENGNCVFAGKYQGKILNGFVRESGEGKFRHDVKGSFKEVGIYMHNPNAKTLVVSEAVIEQMSYQTLDPKANEKDFLAVNGVSNAVKACRFHFIKREEAKNIERVILAFNNDEAGEKATEEGIRWFKENHPEIEVCVHFPKNKDFNEDLQEKVKGYLEPNFTEKIEGEVSEYVG